jgi:hypothetical protein
MCSEHEYARESGEDDRMVMTIPGTGGPEGVKGCRVAAKLMVGD